VSASSDMPEFLESIILKNLPSILSYTTLKILSRSQECNLGVLCPHYYVVGGDDEGLGARFSLAERRLMLLGEINVPR
jgi:hypothetical protein